MASTESPKPDKEQTSPEPKKEDEEGGSPEECLQISSPNLKSIEDEEEAKKDNDNNDSDTKAAINMRKMKKRGASPTMDKEDQQQSSKKPRKKSWSNFKVQVEDGDVVSSDSLKDMVPTVSSIMEKKANEDDDSQDNDGEEVELEAEAEEKELDNKNDDANDNDDNKDEEEGDAFVKVEHLVRPFTLNQLKALLARTGEIDGSESGFYINKIKSVCVVRYLKLSGAKETVSALNNVKWPSTNPKSLSVTLTDREEFERLNDGGGNAAGTARQNPVEEKKQQRQRRDREHHERQDSGRAAPKPLEELFRSTKTTPLLYWKTAAN